MTGPGDAEKSVSKPRPKFEIRGLNVWYAKHQALTDLTLDIQAGKVTAVIGPSGCGKSTLLRVLDRLCDESPDQRVTGQAFLDGVDVLGTQIDPMILRGRVGMVFQESTVFPMSIFDNVAFGIRLRRGVPIGEIRDGVETSRTLGRSQRCFDRPGEQPLWRSATKALYRKSARHSPGGSFV